MTVNVLGTEYSIETVKYDKDPFFKETNTCAYHTGILRKIVLCDLNTIPGFEDEGHDYVEAQTKQALRHEIVHAFLYESGLDDNGAIPQISWAKNEEMVDWIALQGTKLYKAWQEAGAL